MRLLIDTDILLDVLQRREPHIQASSVVWKLCETGKVKGCVTVLTFTNLVYIMRRKMDPKKIENTLRMLSLIFEFVDFGASDLSRAAELNEGNFEDALQIVAAERLSLIHI